MAFSLVEAAKLQSTTFKAGIMLTLAQSTPLMQYIKFMDIPGNALNYNLQTAVSGVGFRDYNETLNEANLVLQNSTEVVKVMQAKASVDRAILKTRNDKDALRAQVLKDKLAGLSYSFTYNFFKGDVAVNPKGFDGLEKRLVGRQVITPNADGTAGALNLKAINRALLRVAGPNSEKVIFMSNEVYVQFIELATEKRLVVQDKDAFDNLIYRFNGAIVAPLDVYETGSQEDAVQTVDILGPTETFNGTANTASIYIVHFGDGEDFVTGLQNDSGIDVKQYSLEPNEITDVEWINGFGVFHPRAACRIAGIVLE